MNNRKTGERGEAIARKHLEDLGYAILETNWRYGKGEIDIIAQKDQTIIFIEVKARTSLSFGQPEDFVDERKQKLISYVAAEYLDRNRHDGEIRFDVISAILIKGKDHQVNHYPDAFFPGLH